MNVILKYFSIQYAPFKKGGKGTLAERARKIGLDIVALDLLKSPNSKIIFSKHVKPNIEGLDQTFIFRRVHLILLSGPIDQSVHKLLSAFSVETQSVGMKQVYL